MSQVVTIDNETVKIDILKTVNYIKANGISFVEKLKGDEKFSFIDPSSEYHEYYKYILNTEIGSTSESQNEVDIDVVDTVEENENSNGIQNNSKIKLPSEPYPFTFSIYDRSISAKSLEILKLTAKFVVCNEDIDYLHKLKTKYAENPQFEFLNPEHNLNHVFIGFVNQYKQILNNQIVEPIMLKEFSKKTDLKSKLLERSFQRAEYFEYQKEVEDAYIKAKNILEIEVAAIDWTKFKILSEISFKVTDTYRKPLNFEILKLKEISNSDNIALNYFQDIVPMNSVPETKITTQNKKGKRKIKLKAAGETRNKKLKGPNEQDLQSPEKYNNDKKAGGHLIECPITKKMIPANRFDKHLQTLLGDPKYRDERMKFVEKHKLTNLTDAEAYENIKKMARRD